MVNQTVEKYMTTKGHLKFYCRESDTSIKLLLPKRTTLVPYLSIRFFKQRRSIYAIM